MVHGSQYVSLVGINYFGDHAYFLTYWVLPVFYFFQSPLTLLFLKLAAFIVAGYLLYGYARDKLEGGTALLILVLYFLFPANIFGLIYEFNPEAFAPPILFLVFLSLRDRRWPDFILWLAILMLIKENMCLVAFMFAAYGACVAAPKDRRVLICFSLFVLLLFFFLSFTFVPFFRNLNQHSFTVRYPRLGNSTLDIILSPILRPGEVLSLFCLSGKFIYELFDVLLILALISPLALLFMAPLLLQHCLSAHPPEHTIFYHYGPTMIPFIFVALVHTLFKFRKCLPAPVLSRTIVGVLLYGMLTLSLKPLWPEFKARWNLGYLRGAAKEWQMIESIPKDAGVLASFRFLAPLATRAQLYSFHMIYDDAYQNPQKMRRSELYTGKTFHLPASVDFCLIDFNDVWYQARLKQNPRAVQERQQKLLDDFEPLRKENRTVLYKRKHPKN